MFNLSSEIIQKLKDFRFLELSADSILESFEDIDRWPSHYLNGQQTVDVIDVDPRSLYRSDGYLNKDLVIEYYNRGHTLVVARVDLLTKELRKFSNLIPSDIFLCINIYMSKGKSVISFPEHNHDYDVLVKNVRGSSAWIVNNQKIVLDNQNILCLPKYTNHQVVEIYEPKLSLTCNLPKIYT